MSDHTLSTIEKMLNGEFTSDPRRSKFPLPEPPAGITLTPGISYTVSGVIVTPEMARDWVLNRSIRRDVMPKDLAHDNMCPNRKYLVSYSKQGAKKLTEDEGFWNKGTHQGGAFTPDGFLLDAQHRLTWSALSGVPIVMPIAINVPWSAWDIIDQNRRRVTAQMLDIPYATAATTVARHLLPVLEGKSATDYTRHGNDFTERVVEICLGWPYFAEDQAWMKEIYDAAGESRVPAGALGSVCIGALAGGAPADDVQQFLNGLRPLSRPVTYETIGRNGNDPRQLLARLTKRMSDDRGKKGRLSAIEERSVVGATRYAFNVWMDRYSDKPKEISKIDKWREAFDLPPLYDEDQIRSFHAKHVN